MGIVLLALALLWSLILAPLLADYVQRCEAWYAALDTWVETGPEHEEP